MKIVPENMVTIHFRVMTKQCRLDKLRDYCSRRFSVIAVIIIRIFICSRQIIKIKNVYWVVNCGYNIRAWVVWVCSGLAIESGGVARSKATAIRNAAVCLSPLPADGGCTGWRIIANTVCPQRWCYCYFALDQLVRLLIHRWCFCTI